MAAFGCASLFLSSEFFYIFYMSGAYIVDYIYGMVLLIVSHRMTVIYREDAKIQVIQYMLVADVDRIGTQNASAYLIKENNSVQ